MLYLGDKIIFSTWIYDFQQFQIFSTAYNINSHLKMEKSTDQKNLGTLGIIFLSSSQF